MILNSGLLNQMGVRLFATGLDRGDFYTPVQQG